VFVDAERVLTAIAKFLVHFLEMGWGGVEEKRGQGRGGVHGKWECTKKQSRSATYFGTIAVMPVLWTERPHAYSVRPASVSLNAYGISL